MGLDMYLTAEKYLSDYTEADQPLKSQLNEMAVPAGLKGKLNRIRAEAAYWRKANAIHDWFVRECQDGVDECQSTWVTREKLGELVMLCKQILDNRKLASELLPTASGFFFGSTEYDEWYYDDLKRTVDMLEPLLAEEYEDWDFHYQSSW